MQQSGVPTPPPRLSLPGWERTPRYEVQATVREHLPIIGHEFEIVFHAPAIARAARPGQFVEILFGDNYAPLVRRPFSLYRVNPEAGTCSVIYLARGAFTSGLARKQVGDVVSLLGPLGRPFHLSKESGVQHILVAGGLGAPPLYFLASELSRSCSSPRRIAVPTAASPNVEIGRASSNSPANDIGNLAPGALDAQTQRVEGFVAGDSSVRPMPQDSLSAEMALDIRVGGRPEQRANAERTIDLADSAAIAELCESRLVVINAARTESLLVGLTEFGALDITLHVMTDDGSRGARGVATDLLTALLDSENSTGRAKTIYACGPMPMLRSVGEIAIARGLPCQLSIETTMPCGIGLCQGCATAVRDPAADAGFSFVLACVDGPVFEARDLVWT